METVPKDSGWAWLVLIGSALQMTLCIGIVKVSGILFIAFQEQFNSTSTMTSLLSTVQNAVYSISALLVMTVAVKITTCRNLAFIGSIIVCTSYIVTSQSRDIRILLLSHGVLQGIGLSLMIPLSFTMVSQYFEERRGFANCITATGGSLGGLIFAPLTTFLLSEYGYQGGVLILSGILLNGCISASLFRPLSFYNDSGGDATHRIGCDAKVAETESLVQDIKSTSVINSFAASSNQSIISSPELVYYTSKKIQSPLLQTVFNGEKRRVRCYSENQAEEIRQLENDLCHLPLNQRGKKKSLLMGSHRNRVHASLRDIGISLYTSTSRSFQSSKHISGSMFDVAVLTDIRNNNLSDIEESQCLRDTRESEAHHRKDLNVIKILSNLFDKTLLKMPIFIAFQLASFLLNSGTMLSPIFIAPYAIEIGINAIDVAILVTTFNSVDLCSRLMIAVVSDKDWMRRSTMVGFASMVIAVTAHLVKFYSSFGMLLAYSVVLGLVNGFYFSLYTVIIVDYFTLERLQSVLGFTSLCHGFSTASSFYMIGYLRDLTGSYVVPFHLLGGMAFLGGLLMFLFPVIHRKTSNSSEKAISESVNE